MNKYGQAAVLAATNCKNSFDKNPINAWKAAVNEIFPNSVSSKTKGCPKGAFLGLCEEGMVKGVPKGSFTRSVDNKRYAVDAVAELKRNPEFANDPRGLWEAVMMGVVKKENSQMSVVIALWDEGLIIQSGL